MEGFERVFVDYHQLQVRTGNDIGDLSLYTVGDDLVHLTGESTLTVMTGPHTGRVWVRALVASGPPEGDDAEWDAVSEATLWCPEGRLWVCGLMGDCPDALRDLALPGPSLVRVRVRAADRRPTDSGPDPESPERFEVVAWPVTEDSGLSTLSTDGMGSEWPRKTAAAAAWAMVRLAALANPPATEASLRAHLAARTAPVEMPRADVRRAVTLPATAALSLVRDIGLARDGQALVLPAGELRARLRPALATEDTLVAEWRWVAPPGSSTVVPDTEPSTVELRLRPGSGDLTLLHRGVRAADAVLLGVIWDELLREDREAPHPWEPVFAEMAEKAAREAAYYKQRRDERESREWGGRPPSDRLRTLPANAWSMARFDRDLLDALEAAEPARQREVARWATRRGYTVAGLAGIDWIAPALDAADRGGPLPPPFDDQQGAWELLWTDPRVPSTVVTSPDRRHANVSQQAAAFPALFAVVDQDPLAAAVEALHCAAYAYGDDYPRLFADVRAEFPFLS